MKDKVVITGKGIVTSLGNSLSETWQALLEGRCGISPLTDFNAQGFSCSSAALVKGLSPSELGIHPRDSRIMDRHSCMLMKCSRDAFADAGLKGSLPPEEIGFYAGMGMVDYNIEDLLPSVIKSSDLSGKLDYNKFFSEAYRDIHPLWPLSMLNNISFCQVAIDLDIKGENTVFSPHTDSGLHAVIEAFNSVVEKKTRAALAGGVSEKVSPLNMARLSTYGILSKSGNECRPFSKVRNGTVPGEGCGIIAIELLSSATTRGLSFKTAISGYGISFETDGQSPCPSVNAIVLSMKSAIEMAGASPSDIDLVIAHADGTIAGDRNEIEAINSVFSECLDSVNVYFSKGAFGSMLSGSASVDIILGISAIENGIIPPVCGLLPKDHGIMFSLPVEGPLKADISRVLINSLTHEGHCASLVIEKI